MQVIKVALILSIALFVLVAGCNHSGGQATSEVTITPVPQVTLPTATPTQLPTVTATPQPSVRATRTPTPHATATTLPATKEPTPTPETQLPILASDYTIDYNICNDNQGVDCSTLQLGDDYLTTDSPAKGYLYSCRPGNPNAPGSVESRITWVDFASGTWDFMKKLWLPSGDFNPQQGIYSETIQGNKRIIEINNLPKDGHIGDWPMTNYRRLSRIDGNKGVPEADSIRFSLPLEPQEAVKPSCVSLGVIGVTLNGVVIFNAADGRGEDAVAREIVDQFGGHPAMNQYHYHFIPQQIDATTLDNGHSGIVGYINDGFPIYGYKGVGGVEVTNDDLDECHGHVHGTLGYHYHATIEYPYTVGCYKGTPTK